MPNAKNFYSEPIFCSFELEPTVTCITISKNGDAAPPEQGLLRIENYARVLRSMRHQLLSHRAHQEEYNHEV
jgi:hypothetical protein